MPSEALRKLEIDANHAFDQYRDMYFEGGVSSVYLWDLDHGFAEHAVCGIHALIIFGIINAKHWFQFNPKPFLSCCHLPNPAHLLTCLYSRSIVDTEQQLDCALDLMRRLPPQQIEKNLSDLIDLVPSLCEDLLSSVDQPLKIAQDRENGRDYLLCDYNRDGDSYRYFSEFHSLWCKLVHLPIQ
ncbi:hypothetical protein B566_EDAN006827 [Ephemera danica]|nr:hypothetical protein B566_EDAN006827 [Ephemera danica]